MPAGLPPSRLARCRCMRAAAPILVALALLAPAAQAASTPRFRDADYLAFADGVLLGMGAQWDPEQGAYVSRHKGAAARTNANLLLVHATAALHGHTGPSRQDERARALVARMTRAPMLRFRSGRKWSPRSACWMKQVTSFGRDHVSLDSQVAEALAAAWRARRPLGLGGVLAARAARAVDRCAHHPAWRFPHLLKNQINWSAQLYAAAAEVTGRAGLLRRDYRRHLVRFAAAISRPHRGMRSANLGRGFGFHYNPELPATSPGNFDTPEYAHIVATALQYYPRALRAGMRPLPARELGLLRRWVTRLLTGSWTHAGYLNWDTGHGTRRWHSAQYWAFAQQGLLAIAAAPPFWARPEHGRWAKALFDRGLLLYARWGEEAGDGIAPQLPFDVFSDHRDQDLYATRIAANAMRALALGIGGAPSTTPPPLYSFDRETGRLAVTTPSYSTAIVPDNRRAFAYGGIELARLFDGGQRVIATTGGTPPDAFGVVVRDAAGRTLLASQDGVRRGTLRLVGRRPDAGSFRELRAAGHVAAGRVRIATTHRFRARDIAVRWEVRCTARCDSIDVQLPTWGEDAVIDVHGRDGSHAPLGGAVALAGVDHVELGATSGYAVTPLSRPAGAVLFPVATAPQPTDPHPGPTLAIRLAAGRVRNVTFALRIRPR